MKGEISDKSFLHDQKRKREKQLLIFFCLFVLGRRDFSQGQAHANKISFLDGGPKKTLCPPLVFSTRNDAAERGSVKTGK